MLSECWFDGVIETMELENMIGQDVQRRGPPKLVMCPSRRRLVTW